MLSLSICTQTGNSPHLGTDSARHTQGGGIHIKLWANLWGITTTYQVKTVNIDELGTFSSISSCNICLLKQIFELRGNSAW